MLLIISALASIFVTSAHAVPRRLLSISRSYGVVHSDYYNGPHTYFDLCWTGSHTLCGLVTNKRSGLLEINEANIGSRRSRDLGAVTRDVFDHLGMNTDVVPSPDGAWFAWCSGSSYYMARKDGTGFRKVFGDRDDSHCKPVWLSDSRHWIVACETAPDDTSHLVEIRMVSTVSRRGTSSVTVATAPIDQLDSLSVCVDTRGDICVLHSAYIDGELHSPHVIAKARVRQNGLSARKATAMIPVALPFPYTEEAAFCRGRVAWAADGYARGSPHNRLRGRAHAAPVETLTIWTSDTMGKHKRAIGYVALTGKDDGPYSIRSLAWLRDGKRLSFLFRGRLYIVNA